jgi:hypothetical protein
LLILRFFSIARVDCGVLLFRLFSLEAYLSGSLTIIGFFYCSRIVRRFFSIIILEFNLIT